MHRTYAADGAFDVTVTIADGDVFLVPRGYHGPSVASPNHDLYYLNVLAGPGAERTMAFCDDPQHHWIRETWGALAPDPRVPDDQRERQGPMKTQRLTVGQAVVSFLASQYSERDGVERRFFPGVFGIFGHGNVAGLGQALQQAGDRLRFYLARNEQAMVHLAAAYAKMANRLATLACTTSIGPGATNMLTAAAGATINRLPVLLLPGDIFATRRVAPVLQQLESPQSQDVSVNDAFRPISRYWDRIYRPEQLVTSLLEAMRVLTSPSDTGAVTLAIPQDVQAEAFDYPAALFAKRVWHVRRAVPEPEAVRAAVAQIRSAKRPLLVAGGGVLYSDATAALRAFAAATGIPVGETMAGKGALAYDDPLALGAIGATGTPGANIMAREADLVIGVGTRYSDFTTASKTAFQDPGVRFVNVNVVGVRCVQARGPAPGRGRPRGAGRAARPPSRDGRWSPPIGSGRRSSTASGMRRCSATTTAATRRCPARARSSAPSTPSRARKTSWCARRAACPATCTSSGGRAIPRATTSNTAIPAWGTRWRAAWA